MLGIGLPVPTTTILESDKGYIILLVEAKFKVG